MADKNGVVRVLIVRHADAGERSDYTGPDFERPLSSKGERQAKKLRKLVDSGSCRWVSSSPAVRCVETVTPLAKRSELTVEIVEDLAEGHDPLRVFDLLIGRASTLSDGESIVGCTHGDVMSGVLEILSVRSLGVRTGVREVAKAGCIELEIAGGSITKSRLISPP